MTQLPYLNLGAGRIILPGEQPGHHGLVDAAIYAYPLWKNVDRNMQPGIDECVDIFTYPWPWPDNSFDGALLAHIAEHIPHEIKLSELAHAAVNSTPSNFLLSEPLMQQGAKLRNMQDGWYAFMYELWRVLTPGAIAHILSPYGWSQGAITDPTHTRLITEHTFTHSMAPDHHSPFEYATGGLHFEVEGPPVFRISEMFAHLKDDPYEFARALSTRINVVYEIYCRLRVVK